MLVIQITYGRYVSDAISRSLSEAGLEVGLRAYIQRSFGTRENWREDSAGYQWSFCLPVIT